MKYCPVCQATYTDESLRFCLEDGTVLRIHSETPLMPTQDFNEQETVVRQTPDTSGWEESRVTKIAPVQPEEKKSNTPLIVILTASVMLILFGGILGTWFLLGGGSSDNVKSSNVVAGKPVNHATNADTVDRNRNDDKNNNGNGDTGWEPINYNASLNGENLTYYRGTTPEQCQADCAANPKCKAFTLIRAGAYNAGDPPMCYLASKVTGVVAHSCCISGIKKNGIDSINTANSAQTFKACGYDLGSDLYNKWKQTGGESGSLGCPVISEAETAPSTAGTIGRYTQFKKGDGGYLIRHGSGRFSGSVFEVSGCMFKLYYDLGGTSSWLGFPVEDGYKTSDGARQEFEGGYILWDSKTYVCQAYKNQ